MTPISGASCVCILLELVKIELANLLEQICIRSCELLLYINQHNDPF